jgi:class 3 adenylate cyclase
MQDALSPCFDRLASGVRRFGGYVDKIAGDEIMSLLGAPRWQEAEVRKAMPAPRCQLSSTGGYNHC